MDQRTFNLVTGIIFAIVVVVHLLRLYMGWPVIIGNWTAPTWLSWLGCVVGGALSYSALRLHANRS
jgi:hypothetical protein